MNLLGPVLHASYCVVRRHDWEKFGSLPATEVAPAVLWRF